MRGGVFVKKIIFFTICLFVILLYIGFSHKECNGCAIHASKITNVCSTDEDENTVNFLEHEDVWFKCLITIILVLSQVGEKKFKINSEHLVFHFVTKHRIQNPRCKLYPRHVNICLFYNEIGYIT